MKEKTHLLGGEERWENINGMRVKVLMPPENAPTWEELVELLKPLKKKK